MIVLYLNRCNFVCKKMKRQPIYATNASLNNEQQPGVIRPPIQNAYSSDFEYREAVEIGKAYALKNNLEYIENY